MNFVDSLKRWFYTNNSSAAGSAARIPLLDAAGNAVGSDTYANLAAALGDKYVTTIRQTGANQWVKITRQRGASALVTVEMGGHTQAIYLITFNDEASFFSQDVKLLFKRGTDTISWREDSDGNLYFISQYGNSRGHSVISLTGQILEARIADSYLGTTAKNVIDTTYLDSYSSLAGLASGLGVHHGEYRVSTAAGTLNTYLKINMSFSVCDIYYDEQNKTGSTAQVYIGHNGNHIGKYVIQGGTPITAYSASDGLSLYISLNRDGFIGFDVHKSAGTVTGWEIVNSLPSGATQISLT